MRRGRRRRSKRLPFVDSGNLTFQYQSLKVNDTCLGVERLYCENEFSFICLLLYGLVFWFKIITTILTVSGCYWRFKSFAYTETTSFFLVGGW